MWHAAGHSDRGRRSGFLGFWGVSGQKQVADQLGNEDRGGNGVSHLGFGGER